MTQLVIDASIAVKWVVEEPGTKEALMLRKGFKLHAPDLLVAECANVFSKKVARDEMTRDEALLAARLLQGADVELHATRAFLEPATKLAIELGHPAYDCVYLALATETGSQFVTADKGLVRKVNEHGTPALRKLVRSLGKTEAKTSERETGRRRAGKGARPKP